jgi:carbon storage regulator
MLILTRKLGETIIIGEDITIMVTKIKGGQVQLGITAPKHIAIHREEIFNLIKQNEKDFIE